MKIKLIHIVLVTLFTSITLSVCSCSALKSELYGQPVQPAVIATNTATGVITMKPAVYDPSTVPPIVPQLQAASQTAGMVVPQPYGSLIAALLNLAATGAAAFATFHARNSAAQNAATVAAAGRLPAQELPPPAA
jgi:hypothetical protein